MNIFKKSLYVLITISLATLFSGCSLRKNNTPTLAPKVITIWSFEDEDLWKPLLNGIYKGDDKNLKSFQFKYVKKSFNSSYENDALNSILSGQGPDVWAIPNDWVYRHKDKLYSTSAKNAVFDNLSPAIQESNVIGDRLYGSASSIDPLIVFYNPSLIEQFVLEYTSSHTLPKKESWEDNKTYQQRPEIIEYNQQIAFRSQIPNNWEDFLEWVKQYTKRNGDTIQRSAVSLGTTNNVSFSAEIVYTMMMQNGVKMVEKETNLSTLNLPVTNALGEQVYPGKYAFELYNKFSNTNSPYYTWNSNMPNDIEAFATGKTAMLIAPNSTESKFFNYSPNFKYKKALIPKIKNNNDSEAYYGRFISFVVPSISPYPTIAWQIANMSFSTLYGSTSANKLSDEKMREYRSSEDVSKYIPLLAAPFTSTWTKGRYPSEVNSVLKKSIENYNSGEQDSQGALDLTATRISELLRKTDW